MKQLIKITQDSGIPLLGTITFGIVDRGSNLLQIRPTTVCNLNCIFCSTDSGADSKYHQSDYIVELGYLIDYVKEVINFKKQEWENSGKNLKDFEIEANIDSVGETMSYPDIVELIKQIKKIEWVKRISMQTNGTLLNKDKIEHLEKAGLNRINLSFNSCNSQLAKELSRTESYDIEQIKKNAELIEQSKIDLLFAPLWIPGLNNEEIPKIIQLAKKICVKEQKAKRPFIGLQKYETHKFGRKPKKAKEINFWKFYNQLEKWEKEFDIKLKIGPSDFKIKKMKSPPTKLKKGEKYSVLIKANGWMKNQMLGVAENRAVMVIDCSKSPGQTVKARIVDNSNNIYIAKV